MTTWHLDPAMARRYAGGGTAPAFAASVEQHLTGCPDCRALVPQDDARADRIWAEVLDAVEAPRVGLVESVLRRLGVSHATARLIAATPALRGAWIWGIAVRRLVDALRRRPPSAYPIEEPDLGVVESAEDRVLVGVEHGDLAGALDRLSPELRSVVEATVLDGLTTREAAQLLGLRQGTVKTRMMRARQVLRKELA